MDAEKETIVNPRFVAEVLSPSTRNYDLGLKSRAYSRLPSLAEMIFIEQERIWIEHWRRQPTGHWDVEEIEDGAASITLESLGCDIPIAEIYAGVEWT